MILSICFTFLGQYYISLNALCKLFSLTVTPKNGKHYQERGRRSSVVEQLIRNPQISSFLRYQYQK